MLRPSSNEGSYGDRPGAYDRHAPQTEAELDLFVGSAAREALPPASLRCRRFANLVYRFRIPRKRITATPSTLASNRSNIHRALIGVDAMGPAAPCTVVFTLELLLFGVGSG